MAVAQLTAHHMFQAELRRSRREEVFFPTRLRLEDGDEFEAQVVNISPHGFMARLHAEAPVGTIVQLLLPGSEVVPSTIVWSMAGRIGVEFRMPIETERYARILAAIGDPPTSWTRG